VGLRARLRETGESRPDVLVAAVNTALELVEQRIVIHTPPYSSFNFIGGLRDLPTLGAPVSLRGRSD
jgi:hypothetical protein